MNLPKQPHVNERIEFYTAYSIRPGIITKYSARVDPSERKYSNNSMKNLFQNAKPKASLSAQSTRKLSKAISWLTYLAKEVYQPHPLNSTKIKHKLAFITLTLPTKQVHTDAEIKSKCLNQFITEMRKNFSMRNYVWKAELQANGNLHFHIVTDTFIHYQIVRQVWNRCIEKLNYVYAYKQRFSGMKLPEYLAYRGAKTLKEKLQYASTYREQKRKNWDDPNTTDIHKVQQIEHLAAYFKKYMLKPVKGESKEQLKVGDTINGITIMHPSELDYTRSGELACTYFTGRIWHSSTSLSKLQSVAETEASEFESLLHKFLSEKSIYVIKDEYFECYCYNDKDLDPEFKKLITEMLTAYAQGFGYTCFADDYKAKAGYMRNLF